MKATARAAVCEQMEARRLLNGGESDLSFGNNGRVTPADLSNTVSSRLVQLADGRLLVAGRPNVARLWPNGQLDTSYGVNGLSAIPSNLNSSTPVPGADGSYYVLSKASVANGVGARVDRYNAEGQRDLAFGGGAGFVTCATGWSEYSPKLMRVLADGSFLFGGNFSGLFKVSPSGVVRSLDAEVPGTARDLIELPDGDLLIAYLQGGSSTTRPGPAVVRINADGSLDPSFTRTVATEQEALSGNNLELVQQSNGRILLNCSWAFDTAIIAIQPTGGRDLSWGSNGVIVYPFAPSAEQVSAMIVGNDDAITFGLSGIFAGSGPNPADVMLVHLNADGERDALFGVNGVAKMVTPGIDNAGDVIQQADGKLLFLYFPNDRGGDIVRFTAPVAASPVTVSATGQLQIAGTSASDTIGIEESGTKYIVRLGNTEVLISRSLVSGVLVVAGGGDDEINLRISSDLPTAINGGSGQDTLHVLDSLSGGVNRLQPQTGEGSLRFDDQNQPLQHLAVEQIDLGNAIPFMTSARFETETRVAILLQFNLDLGASLTANDLLLRNLNSGSVRPVLDSEFSVSVTPNGDTSAVLTLPASLDNADWELEIPAGALSGSEGLASNVAHQVRFDYSQGDTNGDGRTEFGDLFTVMQHFGQSATSRSQGDVNYDGRVSFDDLLAVAQSYGQPTPLSAWSKQRPREWITEAMLSVITPCAGSESGEVLQRIGLKVRLRDNALSL